MSQLTLSILGLSETMSIVLVFLGGVLAVPAGFLLWGWIEDRRYTGADDGEFELDRHHRPADGTLLCDYVDEKSLASIVDQHEVQHQPDRRERGTATTRGREAGIAARGLKAVFRRHRNDDEREYYDALDKNPNTVLRNVLVRLDKEEDVVVDRTVADQPYLSLDEKTLAMVFDEQGKETLEQVRQRLLVGEKREELRGLVERRPFVLIESEWTVTRSAAITLRLSKLTPPAYNARDQLPIPTPAGVAVTVRLDLAGVLNPEKTRLTDGASIYAGVFATVAGYREDGGELELEPIAVFGRHGVTRY